MKGNKTNQNTLVNKAFDNINSSIGVELNEIVSIIEQHGRKEKSKPYKSAKLVEITKPKARGSFVSSK